MGRVRSNIMTSDVNINTTGQNPVFGSAVRAMTWSTLSTVATTLIGLAGFFVLVRLLGPTNYGLVAMAMVALAIPTALSSDSLSQSLIQQDKLDKSAQTSTFLLELTIAGVLCLILLATSGLIAQAFGQPIVETLIAVLCPILLLQAAASVPSAQLRRNLQFKAIAVIAAGSTLCSVILGVTLAVLDYGYWALVAMQISQPGLRVVGVFVASRWLPSAAPRWSSLRPLLHFNVHTLVMRLVRALTANLPRALIGAFLGAAALGVFDVSRRLFKRISSILMQPLTSVTLPVASKLQNDAPALRQWHRLSTVAITAIAYPLYIGIAAVLPAAAPLLFGDQWLDAILPMQLMMLVGVRNATAIFNGGILRGRGKPELATRIAVTTLAVSCLLHPPAVAWGVSAVVGAMLLGSIASWLVGTYYVDQELETGVATQVVIGWESLFSAAIMFIVITATHHMLPPTVSAGLALPLLVLLGAITHFVVLWVLQRDMARLLVALIRAVLTRDSAAIKKLLRSGLSSMS